MGFCPAQLVNLVDKINVQDKFSLFDDQWSPKIIASLNGQDVKLAKLQGDFVWHKHEGEDELFYVVKGQLVIEFRDKTVCLDPGEMYVVPRGVEHRPIAKEEVWVMLFEPSTTKHTGDVVTDLTVETCDRI